MTANAAHQKETLLLGMGNPLLGVFHNFLKLTATNNLILRSTNYHK